MSNWKPPEVEAPKCPQCHQPGESIHRVGDGQPWVKPCGHYVNVLVPERPIGGLHTLLDPPPTHLLGVTHDERPEFELP